MNIQATIQMTNGECGYSLQGFRLTIFPQIKFNDVLGFEIWVVLNEIEKLDYPQLGKSQDGLLIYGIIPQLTGPPVVYSYDLNMEPKNRESFFCSKIKEIREESNIPGELKKKLFISFY
jgi:hypothetical protein